MTDADHIAITDLLQDALIVTKRCLDGLAADVAINTAAGIAAGGAIELRVRMYPGMVPQVSVHLIGNSGEIELASGGGVQA